MSVPSIGLNSFVKRQTANSPFSYTILDERNLIKLVQNCWESRKPGYKEGVVLVPVTPTYSFYCGVVKVIQDTQLFAQLVQRRESEDKYIQITARGVKLPAKVVEIVCYNREALGSDASTECDWEIVSINARPTEEEEPMTPLAMARNMLNLPGGTSATYSAEEFAKSIVYWSQRAMFHGEQNGSK